MFQVSYRNPKLDYFGDHFCSSLRYEYGVLYLIKRNGESRIYQIPHTRIEIKTIVTESLQ